MGNLEVTVKQHNSEINVKKYAIGGANKVKEKSIFLHTDRFRETFER